MVALGELRRAAPWILVTLIAFNVGWIASNVFESNYVYYQCLHTNPARNQDAMRKFNTSSPGRAGTNSSFWSGTSKTVTTLTTTTIKPTLLRTSTLQKIVTPKIIILPPVATKIESPVKQIDIQVVDVKPTDVALEHKTGFSLWDYVNAPVPDDPNDSSFECLTGHAANFAGETKSFPLCIFDPKIDQFVSGSIKRGGGRVWEEANIRIILQNLGTPTEDMGFIDIGANLGVFTLTAANFGHNVVAVEPMPLALRRLRKSIDQGTVGDKIKVVQAALSNDTGQLFLNIDKTNKGGSFLVPRAQCVNTDAQHQCDTNNPVPIVYMDDLLSVIRFKNAVMKIDCEGFEYRAFKRSARLLEEINISYIMMEFMHYKPWWLLPSKKHEVDTFIQYLISKSYKPTTVSGSNLSINNWYHWPVDVAWIKTSTP